MRKRTLRLGVMGLLIAGGLLLWRWPYLRLPGQIAMHRDTAGSRAVYLFTSRCLWGSCWRRVTPSKVFVHDTAWSPNGQWLAFSCSDGIIKSGTVDRPRKRVAEEFVAGETVVKRGLCLVARNGQRFRWLVDDTMIADMPYEITWTLDGQYIIFKSDAEYWYYVDSQTGEMALWNADADVQNRLYWYVDIPAVPAAVIQRAKMPFCFSSMNHGRGTPSPGGRYIAFTVSCGESDPLWLYAYDIKAERLLRLARAKDFNFYDLVWLPDS